MQYVKLVFLSIFILFGITSNAQFENNVKFSRELKNDAPGQVKIIQDARIKQLLDTDKMVNSKDPGFPGYRIQIFSGRSTDREKAFKIKKEFQELFPEERAYVVYKAPDFRVSVGNFRSKIESIELYKACLKFFPNCYPVKTNILFSDLIPIEKEVEEPILENESEQQNAN
ncbi:hypothetical protein BZG02_17990 [Labilibaculum filiforme]|uniref:SPOR domain-containing protein n=1 Tax=Labilibaculum filiforme TaxID=1940526 RepID=A0A2N3HRR2_9BACT|nr:hypothetical protein [Labilibaculum filiforme]PKQ60761.1 hypothetical protein BZG02_17990 [Labilibaculum filiforme]